MRDDGPLNWPGYGASRDRATARTGTTESVVCGRSRFGTREAMVIRFEFGFLGGSVGTAAGTLITSAFAEARAAGLPVVSMLATGGTRMQEGMLSLRQLQLIAREAVLLRAAGLPHIAVLRDPTTGGVWASLGAAADVVLAIPGAQVAFAGSRVRSTDDPAYTAEGQWAAGAVDELVAPSEVESRVDEWLDLLTPWAGPAEVPAALGFSAEGTAWRAVLRARSDTRPRATAYLDAYFATRRPVASGTGMLCGVGRRGTRSVAFAAQTGTPTTPAGYRTATRLIRMADRLGLPVLTLVDTPGAASDPAAERDGVGPAIADLFVTIASARVPVTTLVIGEGGSGGALALCSADRLWITPDAYFSVIAPELAAAILKRDPSEVPELAEQLHLRPADLLKLGVVQGIAENTRSLDVVVVDDH